ncbi:MAG: 16S rRNA (cytosine(1402)-N(4))-methyltransferase, partial [Syntrophomonadaceae bacterium]
MHLPVLLNEAISYLAVNPVGTYVDGTVGGGGHLQRLLQVLRPEAKVLALDKDPDTLAATSRSFQQEPRVVFVHEDFRHLAKVLADYDITKVDGILLDLGVSSFQLDIDDRGFS